MFPCDKGSSLRSMYLKIEKPRRPPNTATTRPSDAHTIRPVTNLRDKIDVYFCTYYIVRECYGMT